MAMGGTGGGLSCAAGLTGSFVAKGKGSGTAVDSDLRFDVDPLDEIIVGRYGRLRLDACLKEARA